MAIPPLSPDQKVKPPHFELRMSVVFAALFIPVGIQVPYLPLWLESVGFGPEQIAVILSAPLFLRMVTTPWIMSMADRAADRANVLITLVIATCIASLGFLLPATYYGVLAIALVLWIFWSPHAPLADSIAVSGVRRYGSVYARMRIWGSISFLAANFLGGIILAYTGAGAVPVIITVTMAAAACVSLALPRIGRPRQPSGLSAAQLSQGVQSFLGRHFILMVAGAGVIHSSHCYLFSFGSIYWKSIGISDGTIGALWAFAVVAEVAMFMAFPRLMHGVKTSTLLFAAGAAAIVRWSVFPLIEPFGAGAPGFFAVQALHALSTALVLLGVQKIIAETISEDRTGAAQGVAFFANGMAFALVTLASGPIYEQLGVDGFYAMVAVAVVGMLLVILAGQSRNGQPQSAGSGGDTKEPS